MDEDDVAEPPLFTGFRARSSDFEPLIIHHHNHQLNWWYALALKGPFACKRLKTRRIDCLYSQAAPKGAFLVPTYSCYP